MAFGVWNNLDEVAAYIGLDRFGGESDEEFYKKIKLLARYKYKPDYISQIKTISTLIGLKSKPVLRFTGTEKYICELNWEYFTYKNSEKYIRTYIGTPSCKLSKILNILNQESIEYSLLDETYANLKCEYLIKNSNIKFTRDYISKKRNRLLYDNIVPGSLVIADKFNIKNEVSSLIDLSNKGDYYIDYENGYIELFDPEISGSYVSYKYFDKSFTIEHSELNLKPVNIISKYGINDELIFLLEYIMDDHTWG